MPDGAIWSVALILQTKMLISTLSGMGAFVCFLFASLREDAYNKKKFGETYVRYMEEVSMWNPFKNMFK